MGDILNVDVGFLMVMTSTLENVFPKPFVWYRSPTPDFRIPSDANEVNSNLVAQPGRAVAACRYRAGRARNLYDNC